MVARVWVMRVMMTMIIEVLVLRVTGAVMRVMMMMMWTTAS